MGRVRTCLSLAALALAIATPALAQTDDALLRVDSQEVARTQGISVDEAYRRLVLQGKVEVLADRLSGDPAFGGLQIVSDASTYQVRIRFTGDANAKVAQYVTDPELRTIVLGSVSPVSLAALKQAQDRLIPIFAALRQQTGIFIDPVSGQVVGQVRNPAAVQALVDKLGLGNLIRLEQKTQFPMPAVSLEGGNVANTTRGSSGSGGPASCTTAFGVTGTGGSGVLLAGHCVQTAPGGAWTGTTVSTQGATLTTKNALWDATRDFAWASNTTDVASNRLADGNAGRAITSVATTLPANGSTMCKYGRKTGYACALIKNNAYTGTDATGATVGPIVLLEGGAATNIAQCGDSGGPVFYAGQAAGVISRGDSKGSCLGGNELYYIPIFRVSALGVTVKTAP